MKNELLTTYNLVTFEKWFPLIIMMKNDPLSAL